MKPKQPEMWKVLCPKEGDYVPLWYCMGSVVKHRKTCPDLVRATAFPDGTAEVECRRASKIIKM